MYKRLLRCVREYRRPTILTMFLIVLEVVIEVFLPFITARLVNHIKAGADMSLVWRTGLELLALALVSLACGGLAGFSCARASAGFAKNLRHDVFQKILAFSFPNIDRFSSSSLVTRLTTDVTNVQMSYMMAIRTAIRGPLMVLSAVIMAFIMVGKLAFTFVIVIPILAGGLYLISRKAMPAFRRVFRKYDKLNESVEENVQAMRVVKGFAREGYEEEKFNRAADDICYDFTKAERIVALNTPVMQFCVYFNSVAVLLLGSRMVITSGGTLLDVGQISAMLTYGMQILISLMMLSLVYVILTISAESMKRIVEVLDEEPTLKEKTDPVKTVPDGSVVFRDVSFKYSESARRFALSGVNLTIPSGATVGIIGGTGSSKSSLVQLIPRLYDVSEGAVLVGGIDVRDYSIRALRDAVAMVLQKNQLFAGTIRDNMRWGNEQATDEEIAEACRLAQADEFIRSFPDGYDTWIEQGGTNVSGGQRQRLCIARALIRKPKILILDDSTSAVDTRTDALIRAGFRSFIPETTKLIIAQRIASVQDADMILVMDNGRVSASGTHEELLVSSPIYREVYEQQTGGGDRDD